MVQTHEHIFERGHFAEQLHVLKGARHAAQSDLRRGAADDGSAFEFDAARGRHIDAGQHIHHRALARTVRTDEAVDAAAAHAQLDIVERLQPAELHERTAHLEDELARARACRQHRRLRTAGRNRCCLRTPAQAMRDQIAHETNDAVWQVVNDEQDHQPENGQAPVGDGVDAEREHREAHGADDRHGHTRQGGGLAHEHDHAADRHQGRQRGGGVAEQVDVIEQLRQHHDDGGAQQGAAARLAPAHDDGEQKQNGLLEVVGVGRNVLF